ncbi:hypothetical protein [Eubacterium xylanophilum]|uniref:hypothetical protein n=1 Tax=Eubacterium xylanophilum TaxID=39497 RepID=UPI0004B64DB1|nr:hypothetical protein [Eubacterium xylanophilum]
MISPLTLTILVICVIVAGAAIAFPYLQIHKRSSNLETGLPGAFCYGALGYLWSYLFYMFVGAMLLRIGFFKQNTGTMVTLQVILTLASTGLTALAIFWGIYLTNQKAVSMYRSVAVGTGFAFGKIASDLLYPYIYSFYLGLKINAGATGIDEKVRQSIITTTNGSLVSGTIKCILMTIFIILIAIYMGHYYTNKMPKQSYIVGVIIYETLMIINLIISNLLDGTPKDVVLIIIYAILAALVMPVILTWFNEGKVENPIVLFERMKNGNNKA